MLGRLADLSSTLGQHSCWCHHHYCRQCQYMSFPVAIIIVSIVIVARTIAWAVVYLQWSRLWCVCSGPGMLRCAPAGHRVFQEVQLRSQEAARIWGHAFAEGAEACQSRVPQESCCCSKPEAGELQSSLYGNQHSAYWATSIGKSDMPVTLHLWQQGLECILI